MSASFLPSISSDDTSSFSDSVNPPPAPYSSDTVVFWATTVLCALGTLIFPLAG